MLMILTENETLLDGRDLRGTVELAKVAERAGFGAVMVSEHIMLSGASDANGPMANPRMYADEGNQNPRTSWPASVPMLAAVAAATETIRVVSAVMIAPLRHPLIMAKELATIDLLAEGRFVVQPSASWQEPEYWALGVPFDKRGRILDEQLEIMQLLWRQSPVSYQGEFFAFEDVYCEPKPYRPGGPAMWFGGQHIYPALLRRLVTYGSGFHPFGSPTVDDLAQIDAALRADGRTLADLELIGGTRATFDGPDSVADVAKSLETIEQQIEQGYTTFCMKPSQYTDDVGEVEEICAMMIGHLAQFNT